MLFRLVWNKRFIFTRFAFIDKIEILYLNKEESRKILLSEEANGEQIQAYELFSFKI